jgi:hypothetical protein
VKLPVVDWHKVVWFSQAIPRHAFIPWLALRDALVRKEKMCSWGFTGPSVYMFCYGCQESRGHLFLMNILFYFFIFYFYEQAGDIFSLLVALVDGYGRH